MLLNCGVGELLRVPWTARTSNQSVLKEINPEYFLEWLLLKLNLQYCGHLMPRANSLDEILMLSRIEGKKRRGWQRMSRLDTITSSVGMNLSKLWDIVKDKGAWHTTVHGHAKSQTWLSNWRKQQEQQMEFYTKCVHYKLWAIFSRPTTRTNLEK